MTLIDYFNQFWKLNSDASFTPSEAYLYFYLLSVWNRTGRKESFECNTEEIIRSLGITKPTLTDCRKRLQNKGLIKFQEGNRKAKRPCYRLVNFTNDFTNNFTTHRDIRDIELNNISSSAHACTHEKNLEDLKEALMKANQWLESVRMALFRNYKIVMTEDEIKEKLSDYFVHLQSEGIEVKTEQDAKSHFKNWIAKVHEIENKKQQQQHGASNNKIGGQHSTDPGASQNQFSDYLRENFGFDGTAEEFEEWFNKSPYGS